jgi:hypothetical protein
MPEIIGQTVNVEHSAAVFLNYVDATYRAGAFPVKAAFPNGRVAQGLRHFERQTPEYRSWLKAKRESKARWFGLA